MIGIATSDWHVGFRGAGRTIGSRNGRELDVAAAGHAAVDRIIEVQPHLVTLAGDNTHTPTWGEGHAPVLLYQLLRRIVAGVRGVQVVVIGGNHDVPRTVAGLSPNEILRDLPGVHFVTEPGSLHLPLWNGERVCVACFPFNALSPDLRENVNPDPTPGVINISLIHAAVRSSATPDALSFHYAGPTAFDIAQTYPGTADPRSVIDAFTAVLCGDFHEFTRLHPTRLACYSGSIERTSSDIWKESAPKGVVRYDTDTGEMELLEIPTRPLFDYGLDDLTIGDGASAERVNEALLVIAANPRHADALVRLKVDGIPMAERPLIDWKLRNQLRASCFHFHPDFRFVQPEAIDLGDARERLALGRSLEQDARNFFAAERPAVRGIALRALGLEAA